MLGRDPEDLPPEAVRFLLREYVSGGSAVVRNAVERALTRGLVAARAEPDPCARMHWLHVLADAAAISDDERLRDGVSRALPEAVDALEMLVRRSYEPGDGLCSLGCGAQLRCGSALLAAFDLSGRLPYAMLAEELLQHARRCWWSDETGAYDADFAANCAALRVLCRLAGLHADPDYRAAAVIAPGSSYAEDARRVAAALFERSGEHPHDAGDFGGALLEWFALEPDLQ